MNPSHILTKSTTTIITTPVTPIKPPPFIRQNQSYPDIHGQVSFQFPHPTELKSRLTSHFSLLISSAFGFNCLVSPFVISLKSIRVISRHSPVATRHVHSSIRPFVHQSIQHLIHFSLILYSMYGLITDCWMLTR